MSLRVWLPLDGNLRQQGISNTIVTSTNATVNSSGKIGNCYSFNGTSSYLTLNPAPLNNNTQEFTYACWFKPNSIHNACLLSNRNQINAAGITIFYYNTGHWFFDVGSRQDFVPSTNVAVNTWNHVVFVYKLNAYRKMYLNGTEVWSTTNAPAATEANTTYGFIGASANTTTTANGNFLNGYLNDVRIYDHALSAAEVHEISLGLILHYKLDSFYNRYGNPNLCKNSRTFGTGWSGSGAVTQNAFEGFAVKYKDNTNGTSYTDTVVYNNVLTVNPSEIYTVSFWAKADTAHNIVCYFYNNTSGVVQSARSIASTGASGTSSDGSTTIALTTQWEYYWITWTFKDSGTAAAKTLLLGRNYASNSGISIAKVKLERGNTPSDWAPHPDDNEVVQLNYVTDSSGYGHIGRITGTPQLSSPAPRYNHCVNLIDRLAISTEGLFTTPNPIFSINFWVKTYANTYTTWSDVVSFPGNKIFRMETSLNTGLRLSWFNYPIGTSSGILNANVNYDEWNMLTLTWSDTLITTYKNGVLAALVAVSGTEWIPNGQFKIGDAGMYMYISDVRIYCTALLPNDILLLYHTSAKVDNTQKLHTFELVENHSKISINKKGLVLCKELTENTDTKFYKTNLAIDTEQIIEF